MRQAPFAIAPPATFQVLPHRRPGLVGAPVTDGREDKPVLALDRLQKCGLVPVVGKAGAQCAPRNQPLAHFVDKQAESLVVGGVGNGPVKAAVRIGRQRIVL
ncbi:hypothetical protein D3C86_1984490 [compost metagenome]